ncbi:MAG: hypothetical protein HZC02_02080 [Candidatus Levybacteria bacterium]|nr:hypothetical protein [Candidatus Levybacteria bacterium]
MKLAYLSLSILLAFFFLTAQKAINLEQISAFTMSNANWIIDFANLNMTSGKPTGPNYKVSNTVGQIAPGLYSGTNFKVRAGFQYVYSIIPFSFTISTLEINFGTLIPTNPVTRTNVLTLSNGSANGYSVLAYENHALLIPGSGRMIPDTSCDAGTCTQITAAAWTSSLAYGFGYRCDNLSGTDCSTDFSTGTFYKQFANDSDGETAQAVMRGVNVGRSKQVQITYKANISATQPPGEYTNQIIYLAIPTF